MGSMAVPAMGQQPRKQRSASDMDWSQFGKQADQMRGAYLAGTYTPLDFDSVPGVGDNPQNPGGSGGGSTTTAQTSPYLEEQINRYRQRFDVDNTKRAIDKANLGIADAAALSAADAKAGQSRRGVLHTGVSAQQNARNIFEPAQRAAAKAASDITLQRERDLDALVLGGTGLMTAPDQINLANREFGLRQMESDRADQRFRTQLEQEERRRREDAARWLAMTDSLGDYGGGSYGVVSA